MRWGRAKDGRGTSHSRTPTRRLRAWAVVGMAGGLVLALLGGASSAAGAATSASVDQAVTAEANWIVSSQLADGAIPEAPGYPPSAFVTTYVSNYAVLGLARAAMVTGNQSYVEAAWKELDFYYRHEEPYTGYETDFNVPLPAGVGAQSTGKYDSTDAYAAMFLLAAYETVKAAGDTIPAADNWVVTAASNAFHALMTTQQPDGLFYGTPTYDAVMAMDNAEDYGGLLAAANLFAVAGDSTLEGQAVLAAQELETAIQLRLWNPQTQSFNGGVGEDDVSWSSDPATTAYPDAVENAWLVGFEAATPSEASAVMSVIEADQPGLFTWAPTESIYGVVLWGLDQSGQSAQATQDALAMWSSASSLGEPWPVTTGALGELIVAETGGLDLSLPASPQASAASLATSDPASLVNVNVGSNIYNTDTPAAAAPFGMVEFGPGSVGNPVGNYNLGTDTRGFTLTDLPGAQCPIFGDVPLLPYSGSLPSDPGAASDSLLNGQGTPGSYSAVAGGVLVDLAATTRTGIMKMTFPAGQPAQLVVKAGDSLNGNSGATVTVDSPTLVTGSATSGDLCGESQVHYTVYFALEVDPSTPAASTSVYQASGQGAGAVLSWGTPSSSLTVRVKAGISYVSVANAEDNLAAEDPGWSESSVASATQAQWNALLSRVQVQGGTPADQVELYSELYHVLLTPETFSDANGQYLGFDGQVHTEPSGQVQYADFASWDWQIAKMNLLAMLYPGHTQQFVQSLINDGEQGGWLPDWSVANSYTGMMEGDPADVLLADAAAWGDLTSTEQQQALQLAVKGATQSQNGSDLGQGWYYERYYGGQFLSTGYVAGYTSLSEQLAMDDWAIYELCAVTSGCDTTSSAMQELLASSSNWINTFDSAAGVQAQRQAPPPWNTGQFFDVSSVAPSGQWSQQGFDDGNAAQYTWLDPEHLDQLVTALGGEQQAARALSSFLEHLDASANEPNFAVTNEDDLEAPWEGDWMGDPALTEEVTNEIVQRFFVGGVTGMPGHDELGAVSSWDVFAQLGIYPEIPGETVMAVGSPEFTSATLSNGSRTVTIDASGAGQGNIYVEAASLGNTPMGNPFFTLSPSGNVTVSFTMGSSPATTASFGAAASTSTGGGTATALGGGGAGAGAGATAGGSSSGGGTASGGVGSGGSAGGGSGGGASLAPLSQSGAGAGGSGSASASAGSGGGGSTSSTVSGGRPSETRQASGSGGTGTPAAPAGPAPTPMPAPIVAVAAPADGKGYWMVDNGGAVEPVGGAPFYGDPATQGVTRLAAPIVGLAAAPDGQGYWLVGADGGVYAFGSARFYGNTYTAGLTGLSGPHPLAAPIVSIVPTASGQGYWLVGKDGGVYAFGDAQYQGSVPGLPSTEQPPAGAAAVGLVPSGNGYEVATTDGWVAAFGPVTKEDPASV
jgi:predicted alpha-1,2-mannosidase